MSSVARDAYQFGLEDAVDEKSNDDDSSDGRLKIHRLISGDAGAGFAEDVRRGLSATTKRLFPKYFYDELGSLLFDAICLLPEYYLTRAENEIFASYADEITSALPGTAPVTLVEMGSGSATKTRLVIEALLRRQQQLLYVPVDISATALETSARVLLQSYPSLAVEAYASDYDTALARMSSKERFGGRVLALFLGSNIGNFEPEEARRFLRSLRAVLRAGDALLVGADLKKEREILEAAYDDSLGVTAAFNLNLLARINRELDADFDIRNFGHVAVYNEERGRVEAFVESLRVQLVCIRRLGMNIELAEGERIHTENSHKYDLAQLSQLATDAGFTRARTWHDAAEQFSSNLFVAVEEAGF
jgi:dimethylhistidine N-methyltransferase